MASRSGGPEEDRSLQQDQPEGSKNTVRLSMNVPHSVKEYLADMARYYGKNETAMLLELLAIAVEANDHLDTPGAKILLQNPDGSQREFTPPYRVFSRPRPHLRRGRGA